VKDVEEASVQRVIGSHHSSCQRDGCHRSIEDHTNKADVIGSSGIATLARLDLRENELRFQWRLSRGLRINSSVVCRCGLVLQALLTKVANNFIELLQ
jgi:hypothetical protein